MARAGRDDGALALTRENALLLIGVIALVVHGVHDRLRTFTYDDRS